MANLIYFVRHGQTDWNVQGRLQGRGDSPLTALGRAQASAHRAWLRQAPPDAIVASPLGRVRATVALATEGLGLSPSYDDDLAERCMGDFEGWSMDDIAAQHPALAARRREDPWAWRPTGGEDYDDLMARTEPLVARLQAHPADRLLVVSHGTIVRPILAQLLALDRATTLRISSPNDLAYRLTHDEPSNWVVHHRVDEAWRPGLKLLP